MVSPGPDPEVTLQDAYNLFDGTCTPMTAPEIADELGCGRRTAYRKLEQLVESGELQTKKVGARSRVWWQPGSTPTDRPSQNAQFEELVRSVKDYAIFKLDPDGRIQTWNQGAQRIKRYDAEEVVGEHFSVFYTDDAIEAGIPSENLEAARAHDRIEDEGWRVRSDGTQFWANVTITAIRDDAGDLKGFTKVTRDMTERKNAREALKTEREILEKTIEAVPMGIMVIDREGAVHRSNDQAKTWFALSEDGELSIGNRDVFDENGDLVPPTNRPYVEVFESGEPIYDWECQIDRPDGQHWTSITVIPLAEDDRPERVVVVANDITRLKEDVQRLETRRQDLESELAEIYERVDDAFFAVDTDWRVIHANDKAAETLARAMGRDPEEGIEELSLWDEIPGATDSELHERFREALDAQESITFEEYVEPLDSWFEVKAYPSRTGLSVYFRDVTDAVERANELERYEKIVQTIEDGVYAVDEDYRFRVVNDAYAEMIGIPQEELIGTNIADIVDDRTVETSEHVRKQLLTGGAAGDTIEIQLVDPEGEAVPTEIKYGRLAPETGSFEGTVGVIRDISERKQRERELRIYETIFETIDDGVYIVDPDGYFEMVNEGYAEMTGYSRDELVGAHVSMVVDDTTIQQARDIEEELRSGQRDTGTIEAEILRADGETIPAEGVFSVLSDQSPGGDRRVGVIRDISKRKERERELERYETAIQNIRDGVYMTDADRRYTLVNDAYLEITGMGREDVIGEHVSTVVGEEATQRSVEVIEDMLAGDRVEGHAEGRHHGATDRYLENWYTLLPTSDGEFSGTTGVVRDITERKERERALQQSEARYRSLTDDVLDTSEVGTFILDSEFDVVWVNQAIETYFGIDREDLIGANNRELIQDRISQRFEKEDRFIDLISSTYEDNTYTEEFECHIPGDSDRDERWLKHWSQPIETGLYAGGRIEHYTDITDRKEYERELQRYETLFQASTDVNAIMDVSGTVHHVTPSVEYILGYDSEAIVGENAFEYIHPDDRDRTARRFRELVEEEGTGRPIEFRFKHADGSWRWLESRGRNLRDDPLIDGLAVYTRDINERKQYEQELEKRARQQRVVAQLGQDALKNPDLDTLFDEATTLLAETLEMDYSKVLDLNSEHDELLLRSGVGWEDGIVGETTVSAVDHDSQAAFTLTETTPVVVDDLTTETRFSGPRLLTSHDVRSGISTIIGNPDDPWGILGTHDTDQRNFSDRDVVFVQSIANILTTAIDRREHERELKQYERIVNTVDDGIYALDSDGQFVLVNDGFVEMTGYSRDELIGAPATTTTAERDVAHGDRLSSEMANQNRDIAIVQEEISTANGDTIPIENRLAHFPIDGSQYGRIGVARDISDRLERQRQLEETVKALEQSNEKLEQFAYAASHDLQEPLRMVSNYLKLIERRYADQLDEDARDFIMFAVDGAERMRGMIEDLLKYSRVDTEAEPMEPTDSNAVVERVLRSLEVKIEETDAEIHVDELPTVPADQNQLEQVFQNLISNAIKYQDEEAIPTVEIDAERRHDQWRFSVADNGIGIDPDHTDRIFEVFNRLHAVDEYSGTGLGLALCQKIVRRHGGDIWVESEPGEGSTFYFTIPASEETREQRSLAPGSLLQLGDLP